ncbi:hypothetical protein AMELA_G00049450 [Ameiurus melas]|uniref:Uncharacterized protein n=1 Tax=Ameiurus melas TaxID=219545 RepID=A0A7J6B536_AMEME|nr:hypothetical protein AMELA_G00049450 [Ameiurus melas]
MHIEEDLTWSTNTTVLLQRKALQRVVTTAQKIIVCPLPSLEDLYSSRCLKKSPEHTKRSTSPRTLSV